jgi:hypothetical protein
VLPGPVPVCVRGHRGEAVGGMDDPRPASLDIAGWTRHKGWQDYINRPLQQSHRYARSVNTCGRKEFRVAFPSPFEFHAVGLGSDQMMTSAPRWWMTEGH